MISVGAFEAKTHLSALLDRVAAGEEVSITKHETAERSLREIVVPAQAEQLTTCDAACLELAIRRNRPLMTSDAELAAAAKRRGIDVKDQELRRRFRAAPRRSPIKFVRQPVRAPVSR